MTGNNNVNLLGLGKVEVDYVATIWSSTYYLVRNDPAINRGEFKSASLSNAIPKGTVGYMAMETKRVDGFQNGGTSKDVTLIAYIGEKT